MPLRPKELTIHDRTEDIAAERLLETLGQRWRNSEVPWSGCGED